MVIGPQKIYFLQLVSTEAIITIPVDKLFVIVMLLRMIERHPAISFLPFPISSVSMTLV